MTDLPVIFYLLLFAVAFLYSSVGHGGASGYLALMALMGLAPSEMKPAALLLNIFVSLIAFVQYYRSGNFLWKIFFPLALASVPFAFLGGMIVPGTGIYKQTLGALLLVPAIRFISPSELNINKQKEAQVAFAVAIGAVIGFLSGMIGIGGGIILSPLLLILGWTDMKQTAAITAPFILVNSVSGLGGLFVHGISFSGGMVNCVWIALAGGLLGSYLGAFHFNTKALGKILAVVLMIAAVKLLFI
jgi:uncharacterized protein